MAPPICPEHSWESTDQPLWTIYALFSWNLWFVVTFLPFFFVSGKTSELVRLFYVFPFTVFVRRNIYIVNHDLT